MRLPGRNGYRESVLSKKLSFYNTSSDRNCDSPVTAPRDALPDILPDLELPDLDPDLDDGFDPPVPAKAERILGTGNAKRKSLGATSHRSNLAPAVTIGAGRDNHEFDDAPSLVSPIAEQKSLGTLWSTGSTHEHLLVDTMPGANGGLKPWPTVQQNVSMQDLLAAGMERPRMPAAPSTTDSRQYIPREQVSDSTLRSYYDSSRHPSNISQQTSDSAVRDMAWRKASPTMAASKSENELSRQPLKSALKHAPSPERERKLKVKPATGSQPKKEGSKMLRLDFAHLLPRHNSSDRVMTLPKHSFGSSTSVNAVPVPYARGEPTKQSRYLKVAPELDVSRSPSAEPPPRPKVFETDVYDNTKVNVRRPPKGIKNWFDGFDISSDEEEKEPVELPASEPLPSTFSPYQDTLKHRVDNMDSQYYQPRERTETPKVRPPHARRNLSDELVHDNLQAITQARQQMQSRQQVRASPGARKNSAESSAPSAISVQARNNGSESWQGSSRFAKESVLNLSDTSEDEPANTPFKSPAESFGYEGVVGDASPINVRRAPGPPRQLENKRSFARDTYMTTQTSGSIPITFDDKLPPVPMDSNRDTQSSIARHTEDTLRQLTSPDPSTMPQRPSTQASNEGSAAGASVSSFPSDASHMMAVTEEEMALLEMMRSKRAMMAKNSFTEGYRVALKREQEALVLRRQSAQKTAMKILKQKDDKARSQRESHIDDLGLSDEQRRRLSTLKQEDVDHHLKLERYLSIETPLEGLFPSPPRAGLEDDTSSLAQTEDLLLLPRTYTPQPQRQKTEASPLLPSPSTLGGSEEGTQLQADLSRFLASGGRAESVAFPLPPKTTTTKEQRRKSQRLNGVLSSSLPSTEEEIFVPPIPSRSPNRLTPSNAHTPSPQLSDNYASQRDRGRGDSTVLSPSQVSILSTSSPPAMPTTAPTPRAAKRDHYASILSPYLDPNISLLDFPFPASNSGASVSQPSRNDSPSFSTSRASPMTPTFTPAALNISHAHNNHNLLVEIANSDSASPSQHYASSDQSSLRPQLREQKIQYPHSQALHSTSAGMIMQKQRKKSPSPLLSLDHDETYGHTARRGTSVSSVSSAAGDVLAAWAELGGGSEGLVVRSRGHKGTGRGY